MKDIKDLISEAQINESSVLVDQCDASGNKKMGFMMYDDMSCTVHVIQFNRLSEYLDEYGIEEDDAMGIDKLAVGKSVSDGASYICTRIW